jgi:hypothetical protein
VKLNTSQFRLWKCAGLFVVIGAVVLLWQFDPAARRVRLRYPTATIADCYEQPWLMPAFMRATHPSAADLYDGTYLSISISDRDVDLNDFNDIPFFDLVLTRCRLSDLTPVAGMHLGNRGIFFHDCDLSAVPSSQIGAVADTHHSTFPIGGP